MTFDLTINWPTVLALIGFAVAGITVWYNTRGQVQKNTDRIKDLGEAIALANTKVAQALEKADEIRAKNAHELAEYKLQVAREYATNHAVALIEERIVAAIDRLGDRFDKYFDSTRK